MSQSLLYVVRSFTIIPGTSRDIYTVYRGLALNSWLLYSYSFFQIEIFSIIELILNRKKTNTAIGYI